MSFIWRGVLPLQCLAILVALTGGFFQAWFNLQEHPEQNNSSGNLSVTGTIILCCLVTAYSWYMKEYFFTFYIWSLGLGNISAGWYFKRLQSKGK